MKDRPEPPGHVAPEVPENLEKIILRCLEKDSGRRWNSMGELSAALRDLQGTIESQGTTAPRSRVQAARRWMAVGLVALPLAVAAGWLILQRFRTFVPAVPGPKMLQLTWDSGIENNPCFSPDGEQVAFMAEGQKGDNWDIYVKRVGDTAPARRPTPLWIHGLPGLRIPGGSHSIATLIAGTPLPIPDNWRAPASGLSLP